MSFLFGIHYSTFKVTFFLKTNIPLSSLIKNKNTTYQQLVCKPKKSRSNACFLINDGNLRLHPLDRNLAFRNVGNTF